MADEVSQWQKWHRSLIRRPPIPPLRPKRQKPSLPEQRSLFGAGEYGEGAAVTAARQNSPGDDEAVSDDE